MSEVTTFSSPPRATLYTIKEGTKPNLATFAVQRLLNGITGIAINRIRLSEDGVFGPATKDRVIIYQKETNLTADGVVGPKTQARMAHSCLIRADRDNLTPNGMIESLVLGESGGYLGAVNWSVPGGVDCGLTQRRVYEPFTDAAIKRAFDGLYQTQLLVDQFLERFANFYKYPYVASRPDRSEYAWRLAALNHNWPYGASQLALGRGLSARQAGWVPAGTRFEGDGASVVTYSDWAKFYAMGSKIHGHRGLVVRSAFGVPRDG